VNGSLQPGEPFNPYRMFNGLYIPEGLARCPWISPGAKLAWGRLARYAGEDGRCYRLCADRKHVEPDPGEHAVLDEIRRLRLSGATLRGIAARLNHLGHRTRRGSAWRLEHVARITKQGAETR
jgi:hypothetical protein